MDGPSPQVLRLDFARTPEQQPEAPEPSQQRPPPAHLDDATRRAWADIVGAARRLKDADDLAIELGAVLLARLREDRVAASLAVRLNTVLIELGVPPAARAGIQPAHALAAFSRTLRARDAAGLVRSF